MGAAHDRKVDAERDLRGRMPQPLRDHVQWDPRRGQLGTGRTVPEAMGPSSLAPGPGRLLIQAGMLNAISQMPQGRLPGQPDNQVPRTVGRGPVGEQAGQVRVKWDGPAPTALATTNQQGAGRDVYVPPFKGHGLADTQPGSPHDERRHPGAAKPQGRQGVQETFDLLRVPVVRDHVGTFTPKVHIRAI